MPFWHYIGRLSEEFGGALPSVMLAEQQRLPAGALEEIVECRAYANGYASYKANPKGATGPMVDLVKVIEFELVQEELSGHGG